MKEQAIAFLRFRWLCLPRVVRATLKAVTIMSGVFAILGAIAASFFLLLAWLLTIDNPAIVAGLILGISSIGLIAGGLYNTTQPSIKRKEKE